jgi:hypothetical protein
VRQILLFAWAGRQGYGNRSHAIISRGSLRVGEGYRSQTKGKIESGVKDVRRYLLCAPSAREPDNLRDLNAELRHSVLQGSARSAH